MLGYWHARMRGCWDAGLLRCRDAEMLGCRDAGMLDFGSGLSGPFDGEMEAVSGVCLNSEREAARTSRSHCSRGVFPVTVLKTLMCVHKCVCRRSHTRS